MFRCKSLLWLCKVVFFLGSNYYLCDDVYYCSLSWVLTAGGSKEVSWVVCPSWTERERRCLHPFAVVMPDCKNNGSFFLKKIHSFWTAKGGVLFLFFAQKRMFRVTSTKTGPWMKHNTQKDFQQCINFYIRQAVKKDLLSLLGSNDTYGIGLEECDISVPSMSMRTNSSDEFDNVANNFLSSSNLSYINYSIFTPGCIVCQVSFLFIQQIN